MMEEMNYLAHHGVKGMKWGVRRYQNEDGSLTEMGKKKYEVGLGEAKAHLEEVSKKAFEELKTSKTATDIAKVQLKIERAKREVEDRIIVEKLKQEKNKSERRKVLEKSLRENGMEPKEAEIAAFRKERFENMLKVAGVVAVTALAVYGAKKFRANMDTIIPKGTDLQHITLNPNKGVSDAFYASYTKGDKKKYLGMYGGFQLQKGGAKDVHVMTSEAANRLAIAGGKSGKHAVQELIKNDPEYAAALKDAAMRRSMTTWKLPGYRNLKKALAGKAKLNDNGYNAVNTILNESSKSGKAAAEKLYDNLRTKGYDGLLDTHDVWVSGYNAKSPIIVFNGAKSLTNVRMSTVTSKQVRKKSIKYLALIGGVPVAKFAGRTYFQTKAQKSAESKVRTYLSERQLISQYKKEHPNTRLSNKQILEVQLGR